MDASHPLDRPVWNSLTSRHAARSVGSAAGALRFAPAFSPLAATARLDPDGVAALDGLPVDATGLYLLERTEVAPPAGFAVTTIAPCLQMTATAVPEVESRHESAIVALGDDDAAEMLALAQLTRPGPFAAETHRLGAFIGIRDAHGRLIAMAGERMAMPGHAELSGVCTHPDHRGQRLAALLSSKVARRILGRGEIPFLHSYAENDSANALYAGLGFAPRATIILTVLAPA